ncbi:hypothetical protein EDD36DRAFT_481155 [Exophiala viscosa]|uniref:Uncharacterized protein n=1 Tax=Exophiala viscosa TaxID=2486360 RepID=A0AAN6E6L7_9EURO|nr:hypothetical protein EDD36DRAFT_481155 [Exophiala viscosa]
MFITYTHVDDIKAPAKKRQVHLYQNRRRKEIKAASTALSKNHAAKPGEADAVSWPSHKFPMALQADLLFEGIILLMWSSFPPSLKQSSHAERDQVFMGIRGAVMSKLHARLSVPQLCSDDFNRGLDDNVEIHCEGLRQMVKLRGGLAANDVQPQTKYSITACVHLIHHNETVMTGLTGEGSAEMMVDLAILRRGLSPKMNMTPNNKIVYPAHPFSPELCKTIATLPKGFEDMALKQVLSVQVIDLLHRLTRTIERGPAEFPKDTSIAVEMMRLSMEPEANIVEKGVILLTFVFARFLSDKATKGSSSPQSMRTDDAIKEPVGRWARFAFGIQKEVDSDFIAWTTFVLWLACEDYGYSEKEQDELVDRLARTQPTMKNKDRLSSVVTKYFFHQSLEQDLDMFWKSLMTKS